MKKGFTLTEILVALAVIGLLSAIIVPKYLSGKPAANYARCAADMEAFATDIVTLSPMSTPTQAEVREHTRWSTTFSDYWYVPNDSDHNAGHGNDLDGCDEENPGASLAGRECIPMQWVIICNHEHPGGRYVFRVDGLVPHVVPDGTDRPPITKDLEWWERDDPKFDKWWNR